MHEDIIRQRFEIWVTDGNLKCPSIERHKDGGYKLMQTYSYWQAWQAAYASIEEQPAAPDKAMMEKMEAIVIEAMKDAWNDICADTDCHPLDIKQHGRRQLGFTPDHWARFTAEMVAHKLAQHGHLTPAPTGERAEALALFDERYTGDGKEEFFSGGPDGQMLAVSYYAFPKDEEQLIRRALSQPVHCTEQPAAPDSGEELVRSVRNLLGALSTCQKQNTPEWMEYITDEANKVCEEAGIDQRIIVNKRGNLGIETAALSKKRGG